MKPSFVRPSSTLAALALAAVGVVTVAEPAAAAVTRHDGAVRFNWGRNCESVIYGYPYVEAAAGLVASVLYDDAAPPKVGEVFYVVVEGAGIGDPYPCVGQKMKPDIVLPAGVSLAVSSANPIRCVRWDYGDGDPVSTPETALCPTAPQTPSLGQGCAASFGTADGSMWDIPMGLGWEVQVPVVASTPGYTSVEFAVRIADAEDNPVINVTSDLVHVGAGSTPTPTTPTPPTPTPTPTQPTAAASAGRFGRPAGQAGQDPRHRSRQGGSRSRRVDRTPLGAGQGVGEVGGHRQDRVRGGGCQSHHSQGAGGEEVASGARRQARQGEGLAKVTAPSGDSAGTTATFALKG